MTAQLSDVLRDLADDPPSEDGLSPDVEAARGAWIRSRRVRRRRRVVGAAIAVVAALLVVPVVSSLSGLRADQPLPGGTNDVVGVPDHLYATPELVPSLTEGPGTPAALAMVSRMPQRIAGWGAAGLGEQARAPVFISASVDEYSAFPGSADFVALSRDGRRAAVVTSMDATIGTTVSIVDLVSGETVVKRYPDWNIDAAVFSPDGSDLAMSVGVRMPGSDSATNGHVFVLRDDGAESMVSDTFELYGWMPSGAGVVVAGPDGLIVADALGVPRGTSSPSLGPLLPTWPAGAVAALSPDGRLLALVGLKGNVSDTLSPYLLTVTRVSDGAVVQEVELPAVYHAEMVGWRDETTPVLAVWAPDSAGGFALVAETAGGPVTLTSGPAEAGSSAVAAAQDLLATVRPAGPPTGVAWFTDARTVVWRVSGWVGMTPTKLAVFLLLLASVALAIVLVVRRDLRDRRRDLAARNR